MRYYLDGLDPREQLEAAEASVREKDQSDSSIGEGGVAVEQRTILDFWGNDGHFLSTGEDDEEEEDGQDSVSEEEDEEEEDDDDDESTTSDLDIGLEENGEEDLMDLFGHR